MPLLEIFYNSLICVVTMTVFSYALSYVTGYNFKEPQLLNYYLCHNLSTDTSKFWVGWVLHAMIGLIFYTAYLFFLIVIRVNPTIWWTLLLGIVAGIFGIVGWEGIIRLKAQATQLPKNRFYIHLIMAHIIFIVTAHYLSQNLIEVSI